MSTFAQHNVFIFNFIDNNEADIKYLTNSFEKCRCRVKLLQKLNKTDFKKEAKEITELDFSLFEYIVIVVLDNRNPHNYFITTSDNENIYINAELLTYIQQNETLLHKKRLFLIQTNQNFSEIDEPYEPYDPYKDKTEKTPLYSGITVYLWAVEPGNKLYNYWSGDKPDVSLFIKSFSDNFVEYGDKLEIKQIHSKISQNMKKNDVKNAEEAPVIEYNCVKDASDKVYKFGSIFGFALSEKAERDFYPKRKK